MSQELFQRIQKNAQYLTEHYSRSETLLKAAMQEAMPWATSLYMRGSVPSLPQIERLATQLVAILIASEPEPKSSAEIMKDLKW